MGTMKKGLFGMDSLGEATVEGWSDGSLWNGWSTPLFERAGAEKLLGLLLESFDRTGGASKGWYDEADDSFYFLLDGDDEPARYSPVTIEAEDRRLKVYPIGTYAWVWEQAPA